MRTYSRIYLPVLIDIALIFAIVLVWHMLAFAQCVPNDLTCMNIR